MTKKTSPSTEGMQEEFGRLAVMYGARQLDMPWLTEPRWKVETTCGALEFTLHLGGEPWVAASFNEPARALERWGPGPGFGGMVWGVNPHTGKWNHQGEADILKFWARLAEILPRPSPVARV
jgi:hypothetical protein